MTRPVADRDVARPAVPGTATWFSLSTVIIRQDGSRAAMYCPSANGTMRSSRAWISGTGHRTRARSSLTSRRASNSRNARRFSFGIEARLVDIAGHLGRGARSQPVALGVAFDPVSHAGVATRSTGGMKGLLSRTRDFTAAKWRGAKPATRGPSDPCADDGRGSCPSPAVRPAAWMMQRLGRPARR